MRDSRGFSIVEVLVGTGVLAVLALGFSQMMLNQQKETRALSEKLAVLDFQGLLGKIMADGSLCRFELVDPANSMNSKWFNDPSPSPITDTISLPVLRAAAAASQIFAQSGTTKVGNTLRVSDIAVRKISRLAPQKYSAELQVSFQGGVRPLAAAFASIALRTDGGAARGAGKETIMDCALEGMGSVAGNRYSVIATDVTIPRGSMHPEWKDVVTLTDTFDGSMKTHIYFKGWMNIAGYPFRMTVNDVVVDNFHSLSGQDGADLWQSVAMMHQQTLSGPITIKVQVYMRVSVFNRTIPGSLKLVTW